MTLLRKSGRPRFFAAFLARLLPIIMGLMLPWFPGPSMIHAKQKSVRTPDLRILDVSLSPIPYLPTDGPLELVIEVELPVEINGTTMLEVSSMISSPSRHSFRFLSNRQPVEASSLSTQAASGEGKARLAVTLTWDGTDQTMRRVEGGRYTYEIRAKLFTVGDDGPRTQMVSWPRRGTIEVR